MALYIIQSVLSFLMQLLSIGIIVYSITSFLLQNRILAPNNKIVYNIYIFLYNLMEPILKPIRGALPQFSGIDVSPIVLILILELLKCYIL
jgi:YggT family protein